MVLRHLKSTNKITLLIVATILVLFLKFLTVGNNTGQDNEYLIASQTGQKVRSSDLDTTKLQSKLDVLSYSDVVRSCPDYVEYAGVAHYKKQDDLETELPFQRPPQKCRTFRSKLIDDFIDKLKPLFKKADLARLFENTFPNTLDTTILYHVSSNQNKLLQNHRHPEYLYRNGFPETFVVTGDIHAEWLRDSAWQLSVYQPLIQYDQSLRELIKGAINTQSQLILSNAYCNAFHPPYYTKIKKGEGHFDNVFPRPNWRQVFECKYEIDSLASFLTLSRQYFENSPEQSRLDFITDDWLLALTQILTVLGRESVSTFDENGHVNKFYYIFKRNTDIASETLPLAGTGNPVNLNTGLIRSAFRPSDDSTVFQFFIPGNAHMATELERIVPILQQYQVIADQKELTVMLPKIIESCEEFAHKIKKGIQEYGIVDHPIFGKVYAYEVDGFNSHLLMDDANIPSLLSLPDLGFIPVDDPVYQNTRKMILSSKGNPYFIKGKYFQGIGGPHIGIHNPWPLSLIMRIRTSNDEIEIMNALEMLLKNTGDLGLIHESINGFAPNGDVYTRPWFAWANSEFAKSILDLAKRKPWLIFKDYAPGDSFNLQAFISSLDS
ncbi:unnamed protein product [Kluyveromyces dobzhanskii CBS 2104]|uniref:WGS project CCBQ000000000 data, contig 00015 n=1 Tax=Kluyveromyces dobzhanskii CBS 2104 TaxID=1427455 RepID=A0A0A8LCT0_9SACH|nr:unnamed protein product [Kluyveromyces dobzhanskii CBS 2104]